MKRRGLVTEELAEQMCCQPGAIRRRYCLDGSYYGVRPIKLPTGKLLWPLDTFERVTKQKAHAA